MTEIISKKKPLRNMITVVKPGPRALGIHNETVSVDINPNTDRIEVTTTPSEAAQAPNGARALAVFGAADPSYLNDILEAQKGKAAEKKIIARDGDCDRMVTVTNGTVVLTVRCPHTMAGCPRYDLINEMWHNWIEQKARALAGISSFGAGGNHQRQKTSQNPATRPGVRSDR